MPGHFCVVGTEIEIGRERVAMEYFWVIEKDRGRGENKKVGRDNAALGHLWAIETER